MDDHKTPLVKDGSQTSYAGDAADAPEMSLEEWSKTVFSNHQMKSYSEVMEAATVMKCTVVRYISALSVLGFAVFNVYCIGSNFSTVVGDFPILPRGDEPWEAGTILTIPNAKVFVFSTELAIVSAMVLYLVYYLIKSVGCNTLEESAEGETSLTIVRMVQNIGLFSLVKGAADIKTFAGNQFAYWKITRERPDISSTQKNADFCFWFFAKLFWVALSVVAFLLKLVQVAFVTNDDGLPWSSTDWIAFLGFVNNMISLYSPPRIALQSVWKFVFAGQDSTYTAAESKLQVEFMECLAYKLTNGNSFLAGHAILLTLSVADVQALLLKDVGVIEFVGEINDDIGHTAAV